MPNAVPAGNLTLTYTDFSKERSSTQIRVKQLADNAAYNTAVGSLETAIDAIINGTQYSRESCEVTRLSNAAGGNGSSREYKLLIRYEDNVTKQLYSVTIPTFDISTVTVITDTDRIDMTAAPAPALKTAFEAIVQSPSGNAVTVIAMISVGRNL